MQWGSLHISIVWFLTNMRMSFTFFDKIFTLIFLIILPAPFREDMTPRPAAAPVPPPSVGVWALLEGLEWVWPAAADAGPVEREEGGACERVCWAGELLPCNESVKLILKWVGCKGTS